MGGVPTWRPGHQTVETQLAHPPYSQHENVLVSAHIDTMNIYYCLLDTVINRSTLVVENEHATLVENEHATYCRCVTGSSMRESVSSSLKKSRAVRSDPTPPTPGGVPGACASVLNEYMAAGATAMGLSPEMLSWGPPSMMELEDLRLEKGKMKM